MPTTRTPDAAERKLIGQALRQLRESRGLTQKDVGTPLGLTGAGWQYYEAGERKFTPDKIDAALEAIGATLADFETEKARILGTTRAANANRPAERQDFVFEIYGRARAGAQGPEVYDVAEPIRSLDQRQVLGRGVAALEIAGDSVSPWAESGEIVLFNRERAPRRGKGCVVELQDGSAFVKLYEKSDGSTLFVRELFPEDRLINFPLRDVKGVYPVVLRGD